MKRTITGYTAIATLVLTLLAMKASAQPAGYVDFGQFAPGDSDCEFVEVRIGKNLINLAVRLIEKQEPDVAKVLAGVEAVRVNVMGLDDKNRSVLENRFKELRTKLETGGWEKIVSVAKKAENVGVYLKSGEKEVVEGLTVLVMEQEREAVLVNVVGNITPAQISLLGDRLHIEALNKAGKALNSGTTEKN